MPSKVNCPCPYIPCKLRGNCAACIADNRNKNTLCNCMEDIAQKYGAKLPTNYPKTMLCDSYDDMSKACAQLIIDTVKAKPDALFCFPAGNSAIRTYQFLVEAKKSGMVDFTYARFVQLDEWLDLENESENCTAFMHKNCYEPLDIKPHQITEFDIHAPDLDAECARIDAYIKDNGPIDFMLLGLGMNAHLGLNEPYISWDKYSTVVDLSSTTVSIGQKYFQNGMKLTRGITLGIHHVFDAKKVVLQIGEKKKAEIVKEVYEHIPHVKLPATVMKLLPDGLVVLDKDAASLLDLKACMQ